MFYTLLFLLFATLTIYSIYLRFNYRGRLIAKIPGPPRWPIVGNGFEFALPLDELFKYSRKLYYIYGPVIGFTAFDLCFVNIYDPEDIEIILSNMKYNEKQQPYTFLKPWLCEGLLTSNGSKWHQRRKMLTEAFHFNILKKYARTFEEKADAFLQKVQAEVNNEQTDLMSFIPRTTLQIMCETTMGTSMKAGIETVTEKYFDSIHAFGSTTVQRFCRIWMFFEWSFNLSQAAKIQKKLLKNLHVFTTQIIRERKAYLVNNPLDDTIDIDHETSKKGRLAMLDLLLKNESDGYIDIDGIREEVDTFLFEGHDTTAMALSFMIMQLANDSRVQNKLYQEMEGIFRNSARPPTVDDLAEMKYLDCIIKETLRLYPSVAMISRHIKEDLKLASGYTIPGNTTCNIHIYDVHRRADLYPEPEKFIPERFLPENNEKRNPYAYIPFSAGPRNCIGQKFAMLEMKALLSGLVRRFRIEPVTKADEILYKCDLVLRPVHPVYVRFRNRNQSL
ncbi:cytochrome P450 4C1-like [Zerene cesonia]|uniref:cytochrome P450 4C1-like n=1 Tax=Zerene cesonia TaxID=33412 RepID=UPI0018E53C0B|nr:cytochrome P450 4C1-like [Zerene cesonia]